MIGTVGTRIAGEDVRTQLTTPEAPDLHALFAVMRERGVDPETTTWDAYRAPDARNWTVALTFAAGGRQRQASWSFDPVLRTVEATDDEARWLSADEPVTSGPVPAAPVRAAPSAVEARLREVSPDALSPREALDLVYALVAELPPEG